MSMIKQKVGRWVGAGFTLGSPRAGGWSINWDGGFAPVFGSGLEPENRLDPLRFGGFCPDFLVGVEAEKSPAPSRFFPPRPQFFGSFLGQNLSPKMGKISLIFKENFGKKRYFLDILKAGNCAPSLFLATAPATRSTPRLISALRLVGGFHVG